MKELFENWKETKETLLEGLSAEQARVVGPCLENQKTQMLMEAAATGSIGADNIAGFRKILMPMIRRIIPGTIAQSIVGVQPMSAPVGLVYSMRYQYTDAMTSPTSPLDDIAAGSEMFGNVNPVRRYYAGDTVDVSIPAGAGSMGVTPGAALGDATGEAFLSALANCTSVGSARGEGFGGRKAELKVLSQTVSAGTRKLQAGWTIEAQQDAHAQHSMDLETEMTSALSAEIVQEIDNEIITDLLGLAGTARVFDYSLTASAVSGGYFPTYIGDRLANIGVQINEIANEIGRKTRRGVGNFIVVSPMMVSALQSASKSVFAPAVSGEFKGPTNTMFVGTLNGSIKVYSYLWNQSQPWAGGAAPAEVDTVLVGFKGGNGETDSGYFYCPYVPLMSSGVIMNPQTFQPVISLMTRYGKASFTNTATSLGNSADYYGKLSIQKLVFA